LIGREFAPSLDIKHTKYGGESSMRNEHKVFLGVDSNGEAVYAEVTFGRLETVDGEVVTKGYFAVSFSTARLEVYDDELLAQWMEDRLDGYDSDTLWKIAEQHDLKPSEIAEFILRNDGREAVLEIDSFFPEFTLADGREAVFTFSAGGQHDTRNEFIYDDPNVNEVHFRYLDEARPAVPLEFYLKLHELWDKYHLARYPDDGEGLVMADSAVAEIEAFKKWMFDIMDSVHELMESDLRQFIEEQHGLAPSEIL